MVAELFGQADNVNLAVEKLIQKCGDDKRVLTVGYQPAVTLLQRGCTVTVIEADREAVRAEEGYHTIIGVPGEFDLTAELGGEKFDVIILPDVIGRLKSPHGFLNEVRRLLAPGGCVLLSVPNIAHARMRLMLLSGKFDYSQLWVTCQAQSKLYARKSVCDLLETCGYLIDSVDWTEIPIDSGELVGALESLGISNLEAVLASFASPESTAFEYIVKATPASEPDKVGKLSEDKVRAERAVKELEAELSVLKEFKAFIEPAFKNLESEIAKKNDYIVQLENAMNDRDRG